MGLPGGKFLTVAEVAAIVRLSKMSVYRLIHSGQLEAVQFGRSFRVSEKALNTYLDERVLRRRLGLLGKLSSKLRALGQSACWGSTSIPQAREPTPCTASSMNRKTPSLGPSSYGCRARSRCCGVCRLSVNPGR